MHQDASLMGGIRPTALLYWRQYVVQQGLSKIRSQPAWGHGRCAIVSRGRYSARVNARYKAWLNARLRS
jgi:hypothetical protein